MNPTPIPGLYEVVLGARVIYVSADGRYVVNRKPVEGRSVELLAQPDVGDIDFEPARVGASIFRPADLA